jgi:D-amino-acid dehydrogenase
LSKSILIVGGGIVGLSTAYFLNKEGHQVQVLDQGAMTTGASHVNAGYISPSHIIPLSAPGVMKKGLKWMFNSSSPLYIKPRIQSDFLRWAWAFNRSCNPQHVEKAVPVIRELALFSEKLFRDIMDTEDFKAHYDKRGLLMLCQTEKMLEIETGILRRAREQGLEGRVLSMEEVRQLEPDVQIEGVGAVLFDCDAHSTPSEFMDDLKHRLTGAGVALMENKEVTKLETNGDKVEVVHAGSQEFRPDEVVLAAGAWTRALCQDLGIRLLLEAGKGYCIDSTRDFGIRYPAIIAEPKVAITPMNGFSRFAGTMEFSGINDTIRRERVQAIADAVNRVYPEVTITEGEMNKATSGLRPVSPDGLPFIGRPARYSNLTLATGHAMMGWTFGPGTGKLIAELIDDKPQSMAVEMFSPDRKF